MGLGCALIKSATGSSGSASGGSTTGPQQPASVGARSRPDVANNHPHQHSHQHKSDASNMSQAHNEQQAARIINQQQQIKFQIHPQQQSISSSQQQQHHQHQQQAQNIYQHQQSTQTRRANAPQPPVSNHQVINMNRGSTLPSQPHQSVSQYHFPLVPSSVFDEDPGIMSEVETSATGFRRSTKARASLPIVRTPSKTQDRSLGLVFLQYRNETKRALLPNEITSVDTVRALFVRSFPRQLTMDYLDSRHVRIYIHDPAKDMFYELEDLRDVRDRSVLRVYEQDGANGPWLPVGSVKPMVNAQQAQMGGYHDADPSYFSEPEFDSEYQNQHIHRAKKGLPPPSLPTSAAQSQYYGTIIMPGMRPSMMISPNYSHLPGRGPSPATVIRPLPPIAVASDRSKPYPGYSQTLPRGTHLMANYSNIQGNEAPITQQNIQLNPRQQPANTQVLKKTKEPLVAPQVTAVANNAPPKPQRSFQSLGSASSLSSRASASPISVSGGPRSPATSGVVTTVAPSPVSVSGPGMGGPFVSIHPYSNRPLPERPYSVAGHYPTFTDITRSRTHPDYFGHLSSPERRFPNGENLVPGVSPRSSFPPQGYNVNYDDVYNPYGTRSGSVTPIIDEEARIRVEYMEKQLASLTGLVQKALTNPQQQSQQRSTSSESRGPAPGKPAPPPKPASLSGSRNSSDGTNNINRNLNINPEMFNQLKQLRRRTKDLRSELRNLRRMTQNQTNIAKDTLRDACTKIKTSLSHLALADPLERSLRFNRLRLSKDEEIYRIDVNRLEKDLTELESQVEGLRNNVINRRCRVNMSDVEAMALVLSRASKNVADLKSRFPHLQEALRTVTSHERDLIVREEKFLKEEPDRIEQALRRCKKLTGTLVTLKRLASVQEQRCTTAGNTQSTKLEKSASADSNADNSNKESGSTTLRSTELEPHTIIQVTPATPTSKTSDLAIDSSLDALLNELQTFSKPMSSDHPNRVGGNERPKRSSSETRKPVPAPPPRSSSSTIGESQDEKQRPIIFPPSSSGRHDQNSTVIRSNSEPNSSHVTKFRSKSLTGENDIIKFGLPGDISGETLGVVPSDSNTSLSSIDSQSSIVLEACKTGKTRQQVLEERHQELLKKQRKLHEQYCRLQQLSRGELPNILLNDLKKTGSESNILLKSSKSMAVSGSLSHLPTSKKPNCKSQSEENQTGSNQPTESKSNVPVSSKSGTKHETKIIYETDIL
ncbi:coiled-coil domain-containing protein AGAP005037 isoform X3 [Brevipalpus obovatus]|uniref:coiled-coil domain-containing protein AGAP005037 isoform X3 n=1 Tax=Brevipalpus obovatus TaxID=246614 RepID=UPI003D9F75D7